MPETRAWKTSSLVPMGGRILFERLACPAPESCWAHNEMYPHMIYCDPPSEDHFVRLVVNDGVVAVPGCEAGPGRSCGLADWVERVRVRGEEVGDFGEVCGLREGSKEGISFLHQ